MGGDWSKVEAVHGHWMVRVLVGAKTQAAGASASPRLWVKGEEGLGALGMISIFSTPRPISVCVDVCRSV